MDATLKLNFEKTLDESGDDDGDDRSCPSRLLEITAGPYSQGQEITITAWGSDVNSLVLYKENESLGRGVPVSLTVEEQDVTETVEFNGSTVEALENVIDNIIRVTAQTVITAENINGSINTYASSGSVIGFKKIGGSCVGKETEEEIYYGTVKVHYNKANFARRWTYTLPDKSGTLYFFVKDRMEVVTKFTVEITGEADTGYRDITLVYTDYVSGVAVEGATVVIDRDQTTEQSGITDVDGKVTFLTVTTGIHYIKSTKSGYLDTDADDLDNDEILVS